MAAATLLLAAACSEQPVTLPPDPPALQAYERYPFGDAVHGRDTRAMIAALDTLEPAYGKLRTGGRVLPNRVSPAGLRGQVAAQLKSAGWAPAPELATWPRVDGSYAFGWQKDGKVYALVGLEHRPDERTGSPVTIVTNIGEPGEAL